MRSLKVVAIIGILILGIFLFIKESHPVEFNEWYACVIDHPCDGTKARGMGL